MPMPEWLRLPSSKAGADAAQWEKCPRCGEAVYRKELAENLFVCPRCGHHFRMRAYDRIRMLVDDDFTEVGGDVTPGDPLDWTDRRGYLEKLAADRAKSSLSEAVVGERIALLFEAACERAVPSVLFTASGGARMEEGMLALMQMAKTTLALERFREAGNYAITVLTDPTTGGVSASFAFQADVVIAEARSAVGFAGRRVIEQTIRQRLPENFQTAEFLLEKGAIDMVVTRGELRNTLIRLLDYGRATWDGGAPCS